MKKCLKCDVAYNDDDSFCPVCGEKLVSINVCPQCGKPVNDNDAFCRHCGAKIEKEYKCTKCGATVPEGSNFCPQCGEKMENPVVSICSNVTNEEAKSDSRNLARKILFFAFSGTLLVLLLLAFIGCFGDIVRTEIFPRSYGASTSQSIEYFFGKAIKNIQESSQGLKYDEFKVFSSLMLVFDYLCWIGAIVSAVLGIVFGALALYKQYKEKDYVLRTKSYYISLFLTLPYLFIFAVKNSARMDIVSFSSTDGSYSLQHIFGWGTTMILVSVIIGICLLLIYKVAIAIVDKNNIVRESVFAVLKTATFIVFMFSLQNMVTINYSDSDGSINGYMTVYSMFTNSLYSFSADTLAKIPAYSVQSLIATLLVLAGGLVGLSMFASWFDTKNLRAYILGGISLVLMIVGYSFAFSSITGYIKELGAYSLGGPSEAFKFSAMGIATPIITILSLIGCDIVGRLKFGTKKEA